MNSLFNNAIQSIQIGIEDYQHNDPKRALRPRGCAYPVNAYTYYILSGSSDDNQGQRVAQRGIDRTNS